MAIATVAAARKAVEVLEERAHGLALEAAELEDARHLSAAARAHAASVLAMTAAELALAELVDVEVDHWIELAAADA